MNLCWQSNVSAFEHATRLVITCLSRSKRLLISWLQSPSAVILEPRKINSDTVSTVSPSICHEVVGPDAMIFVFWMLSFKPPQRWSQNDNTDYFCVVRSPVTWFLFCTFLCVLHFKIMSMNHYKTFVIFIRCYTCFLQKFSNIHIKRGKNPAI